MAMFNVFESYLDFKNASWKYRTDYVGNDLLLLLEKLDAARNNPKFSKYFKESYCLGDLIDIYSNNFDILYSENYDYKKTNIYENEKGKVTRETFFETGRYYDIYLGVYLGRGRFDEHFDKLAKFLEYGLYGSVWQEMNLDVDRYRKAYADLSNEGLKQFKKYIDTNLDYLCMVKNNYRDASSIEPQEKEDDLKAWREKMLKYGADYRVDAYDRACKLEKSIKSERDGKN